MTGNDAGKGTLVAALAEAAFLVGLERNRLLFAVLVLVPHYGLLLYSRFSFLCIVLILDTNLAHGTNN